MRMVFLVFCGCFICLSARADTEASLFFTPDEVHKVQDMEARAPRSAAETGDVHLGAVFYYGPGEWTLWLQGRRWTPDTRSDDVRVIDVSADEVRLGVALSPGGPQREVVLKPYQTYRLSTGEVEEGLSPAAPDLSR